MSLIIKLMSDEDAPDQDTRKSYRLFTGVTSASFSRDESGAGIMMVHFEAKEDEETFDVIGNVYVMNEAGKTISSFGSAPLLFAKGGPD